MDIENLLYFNSVKVYYYVFLWLTFSTLWTEEHKFVLSAQTEFYGHPYSKVD